MIRLERASKSYRGRSAEAIALKEVDLEVRRGEIFGVIGPSGAGKSTLIRLVNLLEKPTGGRVLIDEEDIALLGTAELRMLRRRIGMVFQHFGLLFSQTVAANVGLPLRLAGRPAADVRTRVDALLHRVGLTGLEDRFPAQLSGGQKQRVGVARALATAPDILLCDEATSALDPQTTRSILRLILDLNQDLGLTILLITHEMEVIRQVCDRVAVLDHGQVVESGSVTDVFLRARHATTRRLVAEAEHEDDPAAAPPDSALRLVRLTFDGPVACEPFLGRVARETGVDFTIVSGRVSRIKDVSYGQLKLALHGGDTAEALRRFEAAQIRIEVA